MFTANILKKNVVNTAVKMNVKSVVVHHLIEEFNHLMRVFLALPAELDPQGTPAPLARKDLQAE